MHFKAFQLEGAEMTRALAKLSTSRTVISVDSGFWWFRKDEGEGGGEQEEKRG